jgi:hypothetical protein
VEGFYLDDSLEEGQSLGDVLQDESERKAFLPGLQCGEGPGIGRCLAG